MDTTKPPRGLKTSGRRLWVAVASEYDLDVHEELLLLQACRIADRLDQLAVEANNGPITVTNFKGDQVAHPALVESRIEALALGRLLACLRMPSGEEGGELSRPQRRGGARGAYGVRAVS